MKFGKKTLKSAFDLVPLGIVILDENLIVNYINEAGLSIIQKEQKDAINKYFKDIFNCFDFLNQETIPKDFICEDCEIMKAISLVLKTGEATYDIELERYHCSGSEKTPSWYNISVIPFKTVEEINILINFKDITDLKTTKKNLQMYLKLAEITDEIILFIDLEGNIIDANNAAIKTYGYTYEELLSMNIHDVREDIGTIKSQMEIANKEGIFFEAIHKRKDGSIFYVEVNSRVMKIDNRRILGSLIRDISNRKMSERKLIEQEELFRTVFEQAPIGIGFCKLNGEIINVNPMYEKILGRSSEELKSLGWDQIIYPEDLNKDTDKFNRYKKGLDLTYSTQKRYIKPDKSIVWGGLTIAPLELEDRVSQMNIVMIKDITEQIINEEKLRESNKLKELILSNLPGIAYQCNNDKDWTMQFVSDGCYELTGYYAESLLHNKELSFNELIVEKYRDILLERWTEALENRANFKEEYEIITASGEKKWVFEQGHGIYDDNGQVLLLEGLIIDVTNQKRKEEEIKYLNYHDVLTGLYNRRYFERQIELLEKEEIIPISVIIGDINGLKHVNEALGHVNGDKLIVAISDILKELIQEPGIVARTAGDDFSILLPNTDFQEANLLMKKIETACNNYIKNSINIVLQTSISFGCAAGTSDKDSLTNTIKNAEDSMYRNKLLQDNSIHSSVISSMKITLFEKSQETEEHALRLIVLSRAIGQRMMLTDEQLNALELLSTLHDIGKIGINDNILNKPDRLTHEERIEMNKHPEIGYRIAMTSKELAPIAEYILCHHERFDGKGYPQGLKGEDIPLLSRIITVVDSYDAMIEDRPYRIALTKEAAIQEIIDNSGTQFDPEIVEIFLDIV